MKGSYILLIELPEPREISVGKLGLLAFPKGFYAYVGSAMNGFKPRIGHHLRRKKKPHWHIDYLLEEALIKEIVFCETEERAECTLAQTLAKESHSIPGFGSSDCKCSSHLYFENGENELKEGALKAANQAGLAYRIFQKGEK